MSELPLRRDQHQPTKRAAWRAGRGRRADNNQPGLAGAPHRQEHFGAGRSARRQLALAVGLEGTQEQAVAGAAGGEAAAVVAALGIHVFKRRRASWAGEGSARGPLGGGGPGEEGEEGEERDARGGGCRRHGAGLAAGSSAMGMAHGMGQWHGRSSEHGYTYIVLYILKFSTNLRWAPSLLSIPGLVDSFSLVWRRIAP
eukprot:SAG22_NODE_5272_length_1048_cov_1.979979_2_plen_199_part_00